MHELVVRAQQLCYVIELVRALYRNHRAAGSIPGRVRIVAFFAAVPAWLGLINVYKFTLDNFYLENPSIY
jgi:hypothetical protein